jgi:uncharacterized protein YcbK (DUF882 family)
MTARIAFLAALFPLSGAHAQHRHPLGVFGHVAGRLRALPAPSPSGDLAVEATNLHERVEVNLFNLDGTLDAETLTRLRHLWRCKRTGDERPIDPRLFEILSHVYDHYGRTIQLLSGYRNQENTHSYHYQGSAADIAVPGVSLRALRRFLDGLDDGGMGVGLYPKSGFVHVDVRPPPSYRWVDTGAARLHATARPVARPNS